MVDTFALCGPREVVATIEQALRSDANRRIIPISGPDTLFSLPPNTHVIVVVGDEASKVVGHAALDPNKQPSKDVSVVLPLTSFREGFNLNDRHVISGRAGIWSLVKSLTREF